MEVKMPKEIRQYEEGMILGLSVRQCVFAALAIGVAAGLYFVLRSYLPLETVGWVCILGAAPFAACGFFTYHGMTAERTALTVYKAKRGGGRLTYKPDDLYLACLAPAIRKGKWKGILHTKVRRASKEREDEFDQNA